MHYTIMVGIASYVVSLIMRKKKKSTVISMEDPMVVIFMG